MVKIMQMEAQMTLKKETEGGKRLTLMPKLDDSPSSGLSPTADSLSSLSASKCTAGQKHPAVFPVTEKMRPEKKFPFTIIEYFLFRLFKANNS